MNDDIELYILHDEIEQETEQTNPRENELNIDHTAPKEPQNAHEEVEAETKLETEPEASVNAMEQQEQKTPETPASAPAQAPAEETPEEKKAKKDKIAKDRQIAKELDEINPEKILDEIIQAKLATYPLPNQNTSEMEPLSPDAK